MVSAQIPFSNQKEKPTTTRILFVLDCSQSMAGYWEKSRKIDIAREFLTKTVDSLEQIQNVEMALRVYGHQSVVPPQDCNDTRLEVPFGPHNASLIRRKLRYLNPKGTTPIANSLALTASDFTTCDDCRNVVILITDGIEACEGDPCRVSSDLQKKGIILKPFIIGIGIDPEFRRTFECVGQYYNAAEETRFREVLGVVISEALNATTAQVNLLDQQGYPSETNVNMTFYDQESGKMKYNYVHTINNRGNPDTIILDPLITYRMVVHTLPPVEVGDISVIKGKHTIIAADVPQGELVIRSSGNRYRDLGVIVRESGETHTLNIQKMNTGERYLAGSYHLEIPVLPIIYIRDVQVKQSTTTNIEIPGHGIVTFMMTSPGIGSIYALEDNQVQWIYNLRQNVTNEAILLQPGEYMVVFRAKNAKRSFYTIEKKISVREGTSQSVRLTF
jgi:Ca-activated chloride channel family protein